MKRQETQVIQKFSNQTKLGSFKMHAVFPQSWSTAETALTLQYTSHRDTQVPTAYWTVLLGHPSSLTPHLALPLKMVQELLNSWTIPHFKNFIIFPFSWLSQPSSQISKTMVAQVKYSVIWDAQRDGQGTLFYEGKTFAPLLTRQGQGGMERSPLTLYFPPSWGLGAGEGALKRAFSSPWSLLDRQLECGSSTVLGSRGRASLGPPPTYPRPESSTWPVCTKVTLIKCFFP